TRSYGDWSSDVCSSDLQGHPPHLARRRGARAARGPARGRRRRRTLGLSCDGRLPLSVRADRRLVNFSGFVACAALVAYALYTQFYQGLEPCPLCIFQRIGVALLGLVFLAAAIHNPRGRGGTVYACLLGAAALATLGVAARHVYVQSLPPGSLPSCGAPLGS